MQISARFKFRTHDEYGTQGLSMVGRHWADPIGGMGVAHDMLEHPANDDGATEGEMMALGASLFIRDGEGFYHRIGRGHQTAAENIASDFPQQWHYMLQAGRDTLRDPGRTARLEDECAEQSINDAIAEAVQLCRGEFDQGEFPTFLEAKERRKVRGWMRRGYRAAQRRFKGFSSDEMLQTFMSIQDAADRLIKRYESGEICEWTEATIVAEIDGAVRIKLQDEDAY